MQKQLTSINTVESAVETNCAKKISVIDLYPDSEDSDDGNTKSSWLTSQTSLAGVPSPNASSENLTRTAS